MRYPGEKMDPHHQSMDDGRLGIPHLRTYFWRTLGLLVLGWGDTGLDPVENASLMPVVNRHRILALGS